ATIAQLRNPRGVAVDAAGNLLIADFGNLRIRQVSKPLEVSRAATTTAVSSAVSASGPSVTFTATVSVNAPGHGTLTQSVTFSDGPAILGTVPLSAEGSASLQTALSPGIHSITVTYPGDIHFSGSTVSSLVVLGTTGADTITVMGGAQPGD